MDQKDFEVKTLGKCSVKSPLMLSTISVHGVCEFVYKEERVLYDPSLQSILKFKESGEMPVSFAKAGPHEFLYFEPAKTRAAIVTCGGLCPGLNNVIRSLVLQLYSRYGVKKVIGFQYGYEGMVPDYNHELIELNPEVVDQIHRSGGTMLGSSRGMQDVGVMVESLERLNVNILFCIGGDGTLRGANAIYEEITRRGLKIAVACVPKTIDNDINFISKSFGFETAFAKANDILYNAHNEAKGAYNGIGIVKLMGRDSGFIAASATLATQEVNFIIVPEMDFDLGGPKGFIETLKKRLENKHHALIAVAEGAGQHFFSDKSSEFDKSGNLKHKDIGLLLKDKITEEFNKINFPHTIKYIDPSYIIRSAPADADDSKFCNLLAQNAVHAAMAGRSGFVVGFWNEVFTLLPISVTVNERKKIDIESEFWWNVLVTTGQPIRMKN